MAAPFKNLLIQSRNVSKSAFYCEIRYLKTSFKEWKPRRQLFDWKHISRMFCTSVGLCGISFSYLLYKNKISGFPIAFAAEPAKDNPSSKWQAMNFIADVVEKTAPSVVYIEIQGRHPYTGQKMTVSNGSGFIVREDGLILTNAHVVANKVNVKVKLNDGRIVDGTVQLVDRVSDLATVKIAVTGLPALPLGNSSTVRPGEWVIAMGSPFQLNNTVTAGIVSSSARGSRELGMTSTDIDYIQTDANINFGNSGGPLINLNGEAIGINTLKVTTGISFAIPSDYAREFLQKAAKIEQRKSGGWFGRPTQPIKPVKRYMGVSMLTLTPAIIQELRQRYGGEFADIDRGVLIHRVTVGSPAYESGMRPGDVIVSINGTTVQSSSDVFAALESTDVLKVIIYRGRKKIEQSVTAEVIDN